MWNLVTDLGRLDIAFEPSGTQGYADVARDAVHLTILGTEVDVASLADVIRSKEAAGRDKDRLVLPVLRRIQEEMGRADVAPRALRLIPRHRTARVGRATTACGAHTDATERLFSLPSTQPFESRRRDTSTSSARTTPGRSELARNLVLPPGPSTLDASFDLGRPCLGRVPTSKGGEGRLNGKPPPVPTPGRPDAIRDGRADLPVEGRWPLGLAFVAIGFAVIGLAMVYPFLHESFSWSGLPGEDYSGWQETLWIVAFFVGLLSLTLAIASNIWGRRHRPRFRIPWSKVALRVAIFGAAVWLWPGCIAASSGL